eukprot:1792644-Amphidinium_carterae.1
MTTWTKESCSKNCHAKARMGRGSLQPHLNDYCPHVRLELVSEPIRMYEARKSVRVLKECAYGRAFAFACACARARARARACACACARVRVCA